MKKKSNISKAVFYFGFNSPKKHKRGVENVILTQSSSLTLVRTYYIAFSQKSECFKWNDMVCITIKKSLFKFINLNLLIFFLKKRHSISIIHSHNYLCSFFCLYETSIFTVHDGLFYLKSQMNSKLLFVFKNIEKAVYWRSHIIHFISDYSFEMSLITKTSENIAHIYNSTPLAPSGNSFNKFRNINCDYYLIVRSIEIRANFDLVLSLAKEFKIKNVKEIILIGGKGPLLKKYVKEVKDNKLDNIRFLGYVSDDELQCLYYYSKGVIVPALYGEGFGLPIIEGYAYGKPVIASNVCAMPEIIFDRKYLFENNIVSLLSKIKLLSSSKIESASFIRYYDDNFSKKNIQKQYQFLYDSLLNK